MLKRSNAENIFLYFLFILFYVYFQMINSALSVLTNIMFNILRNKKSGDIRHEFHYSLRGNSIFKEFSNHLRCYWCQAVCISGSIRLYVAIFLVLLNQWNQLTNDLSCINSCCRDHYHKKCSPFNIGFVKVKRKLSWESFPWWVVLWGRRLYLTQFVGVTVLQLCQYCSFPRDKTVH